jgi:cysteine-rich repeat protein
LTDPTPGWKAVVPSVTILTPTKVSSFGGDFVKVLVTGFPSSVATQSLSVSLANSDPAVNLRVNEIIDNGFGQVVSCVLPVLSTGFSTFVVRSTVLNWGFTFGPDNSQVLKTQFDLEVFNPEATVFSDVFPKEMYGSGVIRSLTFSLRFLATTPSSVYLTANGTRVDEVVEASFVFGSIDMKGNSIVRVTIPATKLFPAGAARFQIMTTSGPLATNDAAVWVRASPSAPVIASRMSGATNVPCRATSGTIAPVEVEFAAFPVVMNASLVVVTSSTTSAVPANVIFSTFDSTRIRFSPPQICTASVPSTFKVDFEVKELNSGYCSDCKGQFSILYSDVTIPTALSCIPNSIPGTSATSVTMFLQNYVLSSTAASPTITCVPCSSASFLKMSGSASQMAISASLTPSISSGFVTARVGYAANRFVDFNISVFARNQPRIVPSESVPASSDGGALFLVSVDQFSTTAQYSACFVRNLQQTGCIDSDAMIAASYQRDCASCSTGKLFVTIPSSTSGAGNVRVFVKFSDVSQLYAGSIKYFDPPPIAILSVFPSSGSTSGFSVSVSLANIPASMTASSIVDRMQCRIVDALGGLKGTPVVTVDESNFVQTATATSVKVNLRIPAVAAGKFVLEIFDGSDPSRAGRYDITIVNPSLPSVVSIFPSAISAPGTQIFIALSNVPPSIPSACFAGFETSSSAKIPVTVPVFPNPVIQVTKTPSGQVQAMLSFNFTSKIEADGTLDITDAACGSGPLSVALFSRLPSPIALKVGVFAKYVVPKSIMSNGGQIISVGIVGFDAMATSAKMLQAYISTSGDSDSPVVDVSVLSWEPKGALEGVAALSVPSLDVLVTAKLSLTVVPAGSQSLKVSFDIQVDPAVPRVVQVMPSSFSNTADTEVVVTIASFPVITASALSQLQVQALGRFLPVGLKASNAAQTSLAFTFPALSANAPVGQASVTIGIVGKGSLSLSVQVLGSIKLVSVSPSFATAGSAARVLVSAEHSISTPTASLLLYCVAGCTLSNHLPPTVLTSRSDTSRTASSVMVMFTSASSFAGIANMTLCDNPSKSPAPASPPRNVPNVNCVDFGMPVQPLLPRIAALNPRSGPISGGMPVDLVLSAVPAADVSATIQFDSTTIPLLLDVNSSMPGTNPVLYTRRIRFLLPPTALPTSATLYVRSSTQLSEKFSYYLGCPNYVEYCGSLEMVIDESVMMRSPPYGEFCSPNYCLNPSKLPQLTAPSTVFEGSDSAVTSITVMCSGMFAFSASDLVASLSDSASTSVSITNFILRDVALLVSEVTLAIPALEVGSYTVQISTVRSSNPKYTSLVGTKQTGQIALKALKAIKGDIELFSYSSSSGISDGRLKLSVERIEGVGFSFRDVLPLPATLFDSKFSFKIMSNNAAMDSKAVQCLLSQSDSLGNVDVKCNINLGALPAADIAATAGQQVTFNIKYNGCKVCAGGIKEVTVPLSIVTPTPRIVRIFPDRFINSAGKATLQIHFSGISSASYSSVVACISTVQLDGTVALNPSFAANSFRSTLGAATVASLSPFSGSVDVHLRSSSCTGSSIASIKVAISQPTAAASLSSVRPSEILPSTRGVQVFLIIDNVGLSTAVVSTSSTSHPSASADVVSVKAVGPTNSRQTIIELLVKAPAAPSGSISFSIPVAGASPLVASLSILRPLLTVDPSFIPYTGAAVTLVSFLTGIPTLLFDGELQRPSIQTVPCGSSDPCAGSSYTRLVFTPSARTKAGAYKIDVTGGNSTDSVFIQMVEPPALTVTSTSRFANQFGSRTVTFFTSKFSCSRFKASLDGNFLATAVNAAKSNRFSTTMSAIVPSGLTVGPHELKVTCDPGSAFATSTLTIFKAPVDVSCQDKLTLSVGASFDRRFEILNSDAAAAEDVAVDAAGLSLSVSLVSSSPGRLIVKVSGKAGDPGPVPFVFSISQQQISIPFLVIDDTLSIVCVMCDVPSTGGDIVLSLRNFNTIASRSDVVLSGGDVSLALKDFPAGTINAAQGFQITIDVPSLQSASSAIAGKLEFSVSVSSSLLPDSVAVVKARYRIPPSITGASFDPSGVSISVDFDQDVNASKCSAMFSDAVALTLGAKFSCTWSSKRSALLSLGSGATITVDDSLLVASPPDAIDFKFRTTQAASVKVRAPLSPLPPTLTIKGPSNAGPCESVQLRSFVTSSRPTPVSWACLNDADFNSYLQLQSNYTLILEPSFFPSRDKVYQLQVRAQNFLGASAASAVFLLRADADASPKLLVLPMSKTVFTPAEDVEIKVTTEFSSCPGSTPETVVYSWSLESCLNADNQDCTENSVLSAVLARSRFSKLMIPKKTLASASKYTLKVSSLVGTQRSSASVSFELSRSELVCAFAGANGAMSSTVPINITTDASMCFDPDSSATLLSYSWKCTDASGAACIDVSGQPLTITPGKAAAIDAGVLYATVEGVEYRFTLVATSSDGRSCSSSSSISLKNAPIIPVDVLTTRTFINMDEQLVLRGVTEGAIDATVAWTEPTIANIAAVADPSLKDTSNNLVLMPGTLEPGKTYTFRMTVSKGAGINLQTGYASQSVTVNMPPTGGICSVAQSTVSILDGATIECKLWNDEQTPMKYRFGYQVGVERTFFDFSTDSVKVLSLPKGNVTVLAAVCDALGACAPPISIPVTVNGDISPSQLDSKLDTLGLTGNLDELLQFTSAASKTISPAGSRRALLQAQSIISKMTTAVTDLERAMISTLSVGGASDVMSTLASLSSNPAGLQKADAEKIFESSQRLLTQVIVNATRTPSSSVPANSFSTLSSIVAFSQAGTDRAFEAQIARNVDAVKGSLVKFALDGAVAGAAPMVLASSVAREAFQAVKTPAAGSTDRLSLAPDVITSAVATKSDAASSRSSVRILMQTSSSTSVPATSGFSLPALMNAEGQLAACMKVQSKPWKSSDALDVVAGTSLIGLTLFRSGSDRAITSFASPIRVTIPAPLPPKGKVAKIVFWDAAAGKYSDAGCTVVASANASIAVSDCTHLTDFGVTYIDSAVPVAVCGNSAIEAGEECDDGNAKNGDGCSSTCKKESLPAVEKLKQAFGGDFPIVGIAFGASVGGLILLSFFAVYLKRKYGHAMCCFKNAKVAPATAEQDALKSDTPKSAALPRAEPPENPYTKSKENVMQTAEFALRMKPVTKPH